MRWLHLGDLHLGKRVHDFSMLSEQEHILQELMQIVEEKRPDGVWIAGDIYDKPIPPAEAVALFDDFLTGLSRRQIPVFFISGNHDSAERLSFGGRLFEREQIYVAPVFDGRSEPVVLSDEWGEIAVYQLPYLKPALARHVYPEETIESWEDAVRAAISHMDIRPERRNVLVAHQFVEGAQRCESEELSIGGLDAVPASVFDAFDYVALGHIHGPQRVGREEVRYCGTPLKYSFSEATQKKGALLVELREKGSLLLETVPLTPLHDMRELRGSYEELTARSFYQGTATMDYLHITLTDEEDVPDAMGKLRTIYPNLMTLDYDNERTRRGGGVLYEEEGEQQEDPLLLLETFFAMQNARPLSEEQRELAKELVQEIWQA